MSLTSHDGDVDYAVRLVPPDRRSTVRALEIRLKRLPALITPHGALNGHAVVVGNEFGLDDRASLHEDDVVFWIDTGFAVIFDRASKRLVEGFDHRDRILNWRAFLVAFFSVLCEYRWLAVDGVE